MVGKRKIAALLLILALAIDAYGWISSSVPNVTIPANISHLIHYWEGHEPPVILNVEALFSASGALSVNNPIHVHAFMTDVNVSNFLDYYIGITFTDAFAVNASESQSQPLSAAFIPVKASSTSGFEYEADGTLIWLHEGASWVYFVPNAPKGIRLIVSLPLVEVGDPIVSISSLSDTLSIQANVTNQRLSWILIGFSVLMLQPILESLRREKAHQAAQALTTHRKQ